MGCGRHFCPICGEEFIHRDHRKIYESSSALGQIINREGPKNLTVGDIDTISLKRLKNKTKLFRIIEHKEPGHKFEKPQQESLKFLSDIILHCLICPEAVRDLQLDQRSAVYIMRGLIEAANSVKKETTFKGIQRIKRLRDGAEKEFPDHESFFKFLDPEDPRRRHHRRISNNEDE
jgi:hypothetical protein